MNALDGVAALDLSRTGVVHLEGGMGAIANRLTLTVEENGDRVLFCQVAHKIKFERGRLIGVEMEWDHCFPAAL